MILSFSLTINHARGQGGGGGGNPLGGILGQLFGGQGGQGGGFGGLPGIPGNQGGSRGAGLAAQPNLGNSPLLSRLRGGICNNPLKFGCTNISLPLLCLLFSYLSVV